MGNHKFAIRQEEFSPVDMGVNNKALNTIFNSTAIGTRGFNQLTLEFQYTKSTGGTLTFFIQTSPDGTNWGSTRIGSVAAGVETLLARQFSIDLSAASENFTLDLPLNYAFIRIGTITMAGAAAADKLSIFARLGVV
jgi:hypothetical protein